MKLKAYAACQFLARSFALPRSRALLSFLAFVEGWEGRAISGEKSLEGFGEYLGYYLETNQPICEPEPEEAPPATDEVQMMTVHKAKGLEFERVFMLRCYGQSFPKTYKPPLFEFPEELARNPSSADAKQQHKEEERRLFYVGMTRAKNELTLMAKPHGKGSRPTGYIKDLLESRTAQGAFEFKHYADSVVHLQAGVEAAESRISEWVLMPPRAAEQQLRLSATSIEAYQRCPLQYKLKNEWRIPEEASAALQFGNVIHTALRAFYDAAQKGKTLDLDALLAAFHDAMTAARFADAHREKLYRAEGERHLRAFYEARAAGPLPTVLSTEKPFALEVDGVRITGRIDRIDSLGGKQVRVEDFKSGRPKDQDFADESMQLSVYAIAAQEMGFEAAELTIFNAQNSTTIATRRSAAQLAEARETIKSVANGIRSGYFEPRVDKHCSWCAYRTLCPETEVKLYSIAKAPLVN